MLFPPHGDDDGGVIFHHFLAGISHLFICDVEIVLQLLFEVKGVAMIDLGVAD